MSHHLFSSSLGSVIEELESLVLTHSTATIGFREAFSYRGYYDELGFRISRDVPLYEMLEIAHNQNGAVHTGYKGGEYRMDLSTGCWLVQSYELTGISLCPLMLRLFAGADVSEEELHTY